MDNDKKPQFTKEFLSPSLFRIDSLVTQGKLTAADFPLKTYKLDDKADIQKYLDDRKNLIK